MYQVLGLVMPLFGIIFLGYLAGRLRKIPVEGLAWMNFFIVYVALPALFFNLLAKTPISEFSNATFLLNTTLGTFLIFLLCFTIARLLTKAPTRESTIQGFAGAYGNIGYLGPPLAIAALGPQAGVPVALVFCLDNAMHFTLAPTLMSIDGSTAGSRFKVAKDIIYKIFSHPFILATIAGMAAAFLEFVPPAPLNSLLKLSYLVPIKLLVHPALMYLLLIQIPDLDPVWLHSAVLMAALPSATNVFVIAQQYGVWEERAFSAVVISTSLSIVTLTTYIYWVTNGVI